jgi:catalase
LNAFRFVNANGEFTSVRWYVTPDQTPAVTNLAGTDKNYLSDSLIRQIRARPLRWHLIPTVGQPSDPTAQAASQWPADRREIDAGTITIDSIDSEDTSPTRDINFDPLVLVWSKYPADLGTS